MRKAIFLCSLGHYYSRFYDKKYIYLYEIQYYE